MEDLGQLASAENVVAQLEEPSTNCKLVMKFLMWLEIWQNLDIWSEKWILLITFLRERGKFIHYTKCNVKQAWNNFHVKICVSATWAISGTNMTMAITQLEKMQMLRKLKSRVTRVWRFQICNQIIQIDNIFVDIRYSIVWLNY